MNKSLLPSHCCLPQSCSADCGSALSPVCLTKDEKQKSLVDVSPSGQESPLEKPVKSQSLMGEVPASFQDRQHSGGGFLWPLKSGDTRRASGMNKVTIGIEANNINC